MTPAELAEEMRKKLESAVVAAQAAGESPIPLPSGLSSICERLVSVSRENIRLVAMTNIAGAAVDPNIPVDILQAQAGGVDFRSLYKKSTKLVMAQLAQEAEVKWRISDDPYVSNPYREARIDQDWLIRRGNRLQGAEQLFELIQAVSKDPDIAFDLLSELVRHEVARLQSRKVVYPIPPRLTVPTVTRVIGAWLDQGVGGGRLETASVALLRFLSSEMGGRWDGVSSHHVNDPTPYDALCTSGDQVHTVVEVKDQPIVIGFFHSLAEQMVAHNAARGLLLTRANWLPTGDERRSIEDYLENRSVLGLRIEIVVIDVALLSWLPLLDYDDTSLPGFLSILTNELETHGELSDRVEFASLLRNL